MASKLNPMGFKPGPIGPIPHPTDPRSAPTVFAESRSLHYPNAMRFQDLATILLAAGSIGATAAAESQFLEDFSFKIPYAGLPRPASWVANAEQCAVRISYGSSNSIPTLPDSPPARAWLLTGDGKSVSPDAFPMFVRLSNLGQTGCLQVFTFPRVGAVSNAVAVVVGIGTNFVVHSILKPQP